MRGKLATLKGGDGEPLYGEDQLDKLVMDELWTPLVREGVIPENQVPDRYSKLAQTFDGAVAQYNERLERFTENRAANAGILDKLGKGKFVVEGVGSIASNIAGAVGAVNPTPGIDVASTVIDLVNVTMAGGLTVVEGLVQRNAEDAVDSVGGILKKFVGEFAGPEVGDLVGSAYTAATNGPKVAYYLANNEPEKAIDTFIIYFEAAFSVLDDVSTGGDYARIGAEIGQALKGGKVVVKLSQAVLTNDSAGIIDALQEGIQVGVARAGKELKGLHGKRTNQSEDDISSAQNGVEEGIGKSSEAISTLLKSDDDDWQKAMREKLEALEQKKIEDELEQSTLEFQNLLVNGFALPNDGQEEDAQAMRRQMDSIDALILQMQKDRMILEALDKLVGAGLKVAAQFLPEFAVASHAKEFAKRVVAAALRAQELNEWLENLSDASSAVSVYAEPMKRRIKDSKIQLSKETIQAVLEMAQLVGAAAQCSRVPEAVAVGKAVELGGAALSTAADLAYFVYEEVDLAVQWSTYKSALRTPQNRKLARKAMRGNPTLAKYTLAYGALIDRDPIAMEAMQKCGLTDKVLTNPEANCHKVVLYLETKFADDPVLERSVPDKKAWHPGKPELTLRSWMAFLTAAKTAAKPALVLEGNGAVDGALAHLESARSAYRAVQDEQDEDKLSAIDEVITNLNDVKQAARRYSPEGADGKSHASMKDYVDSLVAMAELETRSITVERTKLVA